jgi:hypothetical protein
LSVLTKDVKAFSIQNRENLFFARAP